MGGKDGQKEALAAHVSGQSNKPISKPAHSLSFDEVLKELGGSGLDGLSDGEADKRLTEYGKNELDNGPGVNPVKILVRQIANAMMLVSTNPGTVLNSTNGAGPSTWHGCLVRHRIIHRRWCRSWHHHLKHRDWFHAGILR